MPLLTASHYFLALSGTAGALLWGVGTWNGSMMDLTSTAWLGHFEDGSPLYTKYTGFFPIDFPLAVLVAFFYKGTNGSDRDAQLFIIDVFASVQPAVLWFSADNAQPGSQAINLWIPLVWGMLCQALGAGVIFPLYFMYQLKIEKLKRTDRGKRQKQNVYVSYAAVKMMPVSYLLGGVLPWFLVGYSPATRKSSTHQQLLAVFQLCPVWVSLAQLIGMKLVGDNSNMMSHERQVTKARYWMKYSYATAIIPSAVAHLYVLWTALMSDAFSSTRMYVPHLYSGPLGVNTLALRGPWLFLQYDYIIITLSSISWAYILLSRSIGSENKFSLMLWLLVGTLAFGSGATVSFALYTREKLEVKRGLKQKPKN